MDEVTKYATSSIIIYMSKRMPKPHIYVELAWPVVMNIAPSYDTT